MADIYFKTGGVWTKVQRPYVKRGGVWTPVKEVWRKVSGVWIQSFLWDITPPPPPSIELNLVPKNGGRYIDIGVNIPGANNPNVAMIRLLAGTTGYPATQFGGTYYTTPDPDFPSEPWSDMFYGAGKEHHDTGVQVFRQYPNTANTQEKPTLAAGTYYFNAWTLDVAGNWSMNTALSISVPKTGVGNNLIVRDARFQADFSGSYVNGTGFVTGDLRQATNPAVSRGLYMYGSDMTTEIGSAYGDASVTITNCQIWLRRIDTDGQPTANVYIFRHGYATPGSITGDLTAVAETVKLGTLAKGEGKWFALPTSYYPDLINGTTKGFGFFYKNPTNAAAGAEDYSVISGLLEDNRRQGELFVTWTENPG